MKKSKALFACLGLAVFSQADAEIVQLTAQGTIASAPDASWLDLLGDEVSLSFQYDDTGTPPDSIAPSGLNGSISRWNATLFQSLQVNIDGQAGQAFGSSADIWGGSTVRIQDGGTLPLPPPLNNGPDALTVSMAFVYETIPTTVTITNPPPCGGGGRGEPPCTETITFDQPNNDNLFEYRSSYLTSVYLDFPSLSGATLPDSTLASLTSAAFPAASATLQLFFTDRSGQLPGLRLTPLTVNLNSVDVAPVPLPAAAWLLLSGIGALGFVRRRAGVRS